MRYDLINKLNENFPSNHLNKNVCVFGQGFVGLPLTLSFAFRGSNAIGVDVEKNLVDEINNGLTHHTEKFHGISIQEILKLQLENGRYKATTDGDEAVKKSNNIIVTVGIPIVDGKYVIDYLKSATETIARNLKKGDLVIIRSTVIPGTTEDLVLPILEEISGMEAGKDFYLAYASERIAEGFAFDEFANMPTIVGAVNEESLQRAISLLSVVCKAEVIPSKSIKAVETSKVFENVQRDVNIAMAQEFARFTEGLGIDIFEVVSLANTHKRVNILTPGPGVGGYCIPNAYHYIAPKAEEIGISMDILKLARMKNSELPGFIVNTIRKMLANVGKDLKDSKIAVLGLAMKDFSNDDRISPPIEICNILIEQEAKVFAFDPVVATDYDYKYDTQDEVLRDADVVVILTKQHEIDFDVTNIYKNAKKDVIIIDTKAVIDKEKLYKKENYWRI